MYNPLTRLIRATIETGFLTAFWALLILAIFLWNSDTNGTPPKLSRWICETHPFLTVYVGLVICEGRIATLTLLYNRAAVPSPPLACRTLMSIPLQ